MSKKTFFYVLVNIQPRQYSTVLYEKKGIGFTSKNKLLKLLVKFTNDYEKSSSYTLKT